MIKHDYFFFTLCIQIEPIQQSEYNYLTHVHKLFFCLKKW